MTTRSNSDNINDLLRERPINWAVIEEQAKTDKESFPKDFLATILLLGTTGSLSFALFEWFVLQFGDSAGYYGLGCSHEEASTETYQSRVEKIDKSYRVRREYFFKCKSLESAELYWSVFGDSRRVIYDAMDFILGYSVEVESNAWCTAKMSKTEVWECYLFLARKLSADCTWAWSSGDEMGRILVGHAVIHVTIEMAQNSKCEKPLLAELVSCLNFLHTHDPDVFLEQNDGGSTMLGIVASKSNQIANSIYEPPANTQCCAEAIQELILQLSPEACKVRSPDGRLPLHNALLEGSYDLARFMQMTFPTTVECRCPVTGLYPFQLASTRPKTQPACKCSWCAKCDTSLSSLTSAFTFLRQAPHLVIVVACSNEDPAGDDCLSVNRRELEREELQLLRRRMNFEHERRTLARNERVWSVKKRKLEREELETSADDELVLGA